MTTHILTAAGAQGSPNLIDEQVQHCNLKLVEETEGPRAGRVFARGEFGHASKPTANGRLYKHSIWEQNFNRLGPNLKRKKVVGELDHPTDGRTALQRASHVITDLRLEGDIVMGEAEILDTAKGRDLKAILQAGVPVGISSRGFGSTKPVREGLEEVQPDYKLITFDFVAEPADDTAYPEIVFESVTPEGTQMMFEGVELPLEQQLRLEEEATEDDRLAAEFVRRSIGGEEGEEAQRAVRDEFAKAILDRLGEMRETVREEVRAELLADPEVAGAKTVLETLRTTLLPFVLPSDTAAMLKAKDEQIDALEERVEDLELQLESSQGLIEQLAEAARVAGYRYYVEREITEDEHPALVRQLVGDVSECEDVEELKARIEEAREAASEHVEQQALVEEQRTRGEREMAAKNEELARGLQESMELNQQLGLRLYAVQRLQTHPDGAKILRVLETAGFQSKKQVDDVIEEWREPEWQHDDAEAVRARVRSLLVSGQEHLQEEIRVQNSRTPMDYQGLGAPLHELKRLAGVGSGRSE
jgi:hypothetical protein